MSKRSVVVAFMTFIINIPLAIIVLSISPILSGIILGVGLTIVGGIALGFIIV